MRTETGDKIVDWYMALADDKSVPAEVRDFARAQLRACALRLPHQTVEDVIGTAQ
ncbi:hypothetical protein [Hyphomicrobium sp. ghe19]|uniref:hypothetical protein n=1 Tax=Hyphomicrobium sp. ghe19 TaxID=2682968 RepID=UPI0030D3FA82